MVPSYGEAAQAFDPSDFRAIALDGVVVPRGAREDWGWIRSL